MAYRHVKCDFCGADLGSYHGHEFKIVIRRHFQLEHPSQLAKMEEANRVLLELKKEYKYNGYL